MMNLEISQKQLLVSQKALESSQKNYESASERYNLGAASIIEFQRANTQFINSQLNRVNAVYNYYKAKKELLNAVGIKQ
jgi:outer membrane protein TolC